MNTDVIPRPEFQAPSSLVSGARVGAVAGLLSGGLVGLVTASLSAAATTVGVGFLVGSAAGPLVSYAVRNRHSTTIVPVTFAALGVMAGALLTPLYANLGLGLAATGSFGLTPESLSVSSVAVLFGSLAGVFLGLTAGGILSTTPRDPENPIHRPAKAAAAVSALVFGGGLLGSTVLPFYLPEVSSMGSWWLGVLGCAIGFNALGMILPSLLAGLATFAGGMLLETRTAWDETSAPRPNFPAGLASQASQEYLALLAGDFNG